MASLLRSSPTPRCSSCIRSLLAVPANEYTIPSVSRQQIRGKKINAKDIDKSVKVRLLQDIRGYGAAGTLIPLAPGRMRNIFFPQGKAQYLTMDEIKKLKKAGTPIERDYTYAKRQKITTPEPDISEINESPLARLIAPVRINVERHLLKPERATEVLEKLLPANIDFYRKPVVTATPPLPTPTRLRRQSPSISGAATLSAEAQAVQDERDAALQAAKEAEEARKNEKVAIYGSVTTADIVANLKAILAEDEEAKRIVFGTEEVSFVRQEGEESEEDADRVKHLGIFEIEIKMKGAPFAVSRTIKVNASE